MSSSGARKRTWERRLIEAQKKHRPSLKDWTCDGFASIRAGDFKRYKEMCIEEMSVVHLRIDRVHCTEVSPDEFILRYEKPCKPVIIKGIPAAEGWSANKEWNSFKRLKKKLGRRMFKVGEDDDGYKVKVKFKYFLKYLEKNKDDSPLYVFDGNYDDDPVSKCLLQQYAVPSYFPDDLFRLVGEKHRPPYRWFLCGPARSGTCVHIDPLGTSAWNTVIKGYKRWVLFPPTTLRKVAKALDVQDDDEDDEAVHYFLDFLPRLRAALEKQTDPMAESGCRSTDIIEFTQGPGETVFVPGGWWHSVLNVTDTVAVTQNFCSRTNFLKVWKETRNGRKKMSVRWLKQLTEHYPDLAKLALKANAQDGFVMYDERKRRKEERARLEAEKEKDTTSESGSSISTFSSSPTTPAKEEEMKKARAKEQKRSKSNKHVSKAKLEKREKKERKRAATALTSEESASEASFSSADETQARRKMQKFKL